MSQGEHFVQFYESDDYLMESVAEYLVHGIKVNEACMVLATAEHLNKIERLLEAFGRDLYAAKEEDRLILLNIDEMIGELIDENGPSETAFESMIGKTVREAQERFETVRIYGELVDVLAIRGQHDDARKVEEFWNRLRTEVPFSLFCGYALDGFAEDGLSEKMVGVCDQHTKVIPAESYTSLAADERSRAVTLLQRRVRELEAEIAKLSSSGLPIADLGH